MFSRFFRASNVQHAAISGVGLGLSIARHVVGAQGGTITVDSVVGQGTVATIALPLTGTSNGVGRRVLSRIRSRAR